MPDLDDRLPDRRVDDPVADRRSLADEIFHGDRQEDLAAAIWLAAVSQKTSLGTRKQRHLLEQFGGLSGLFAASPQAICACLPAPPDRISLIQRQLNDPNLRQQARQNARNAWYQGVRALAITDGQYPVRLSRTDSGPAVLFYRGSQLPALLKRSLWVTVIGTRNPTYYGRTVTQRITADLVAHGTVIISGLARGIDTIAHQTAIRDQGLTVAVVGCGLDIAYPPENRALMETIAECGLLLSEYSPGTPPRRQHFPARNRILSGLADVVAIMEASRKSGTLITAGFAADQGRDVYAVPGSILDDASAGCHQLIRDGASLLESAQDILWRNPANYLEMLVWSANQASLSAKPSHATDSPETGESGETVNPAKPGATAKPGDSQRPVRPGHPGEDQRSDRLPGARPLLPDRLQLERPEGLLDTTWQPQILLRLLRGQRLSLDQLVRLTERSLPEVSTALSLFELGGAVVCERGRYALTEQGHLSI